MLKESESLVYDLQKKVDTLNKTLETNNSSLLNKKDNV